MYEIIIARHIILGYFELFVFLWPRKRAKCAYGAKWAKYGAAVTSNQLGRKFADTLPLPPLSKVLFF